MKTIIISTGSELVKGEIVDTNSAFLAAACADIGLEITSIRVIGDNAEQLGHILIKILSKVDVILITGGLGPTVDDITTAAVAQAFGLQIVLNEKELDTLKAKFALFKRSFPETNIKQAMFPEGATVLDNAVGTAPGWLLEQQNTLIFAMPGVPPEMKTMFEHQVKPRLQDRFNLKPQPRLRILTYGLAESKLQALLGDLTDNFPDLQIAFGAHIYGIEIKLSYPASESETQKRLSDAKYEIEKRLGHNFIGTGDIRLEEEIGMMLRGKKQTLATAESFTGGLIGDLVTDVAGSSDYFLEGVVTYSNEAKERLLHVSSRHIQEFGAVSEAVASEMAYGARANANATFGLSTTGIAGPGGGSMEKPVGLAYLGLATPSGIYVRKVILPGNRKQIKARGAYSVLHLLWRYLKFGPSNLEP